MKLYTEEQVKEMIEKSQDTGLTAEFLILTRPSIELPSDEEIKQKSYNKFIQSNAQICFQEGAKWMKSKILGNNHLGGISY